jgi:hypothetical protein
LLALIFKTVRVCVYRPIGAPARTYFT